MVDTRDDLNWDLHDEGSTGDGDTGVETPDQAHRLAVEKLDALLAHLDSALAPADDGITMVGTPPPPPDDPAPLPAAPRRRRVRVGGAAAWFLSTVAVAVGLILFQNVVVPAANDVVDASVDGVTEVAARLNETWQGMTTGLEDTAVGGPVVAAAPVAAGEATSVLLSVAADDGRGAAFALLVEAADGDRVLVLAPPDLLAIQPGYGDFPIADAVLFEGPELAGLTLTNLLGIRVDDVVDLRPGDLTELLPEVVDVDLANPLILADGDEGRVIARAGSASRSGELAEMIMLHPGAGDQLDWLQRQGGVWRTILDSIAADPDIAAGMAEGAAVDPSEVEAMLLEAAVDEDLIITALPVRRVSVGGAGVGYGIDGDSIGGFVDQRMGDLLIRTGPRPRVELLNGNGRIGTTRVVAEQLVRRGYRVIKTDNADSFQYETTQVIGQGRDNRPFADDVIGVLGKGDLLLEVRAPSGVVDITVIVGADIPAGEG
jgi:hypothetical protein